MRVEFWGVRADFPTPDADKIRYGGNTNCVVVSSDGAPDHFFVLDAGTGFAIFGSTLNPLNGHEALIMLSHMHLQHIIGFQFTPFAFSKAYKSLVIGPSPYDHQMEQVFDAAMEPHYSPVSGIANLLAEVKFVEVDSQIRQIGDTMIIAQPFEHTTDTRSWGYRLINDRGSLSYLTDTTIRREDGRILQAAIQFSKDADILILGATDPRYNRGDEISYGDAIELARAAHVGHLVLHNHHPNTTDDELDRYQALLNEENPDLRITIAAERMVLEL